MEIEGSQPVMAKKIWNIARLVFFMLRKGIAKSKLVVELHMFLKRGKLAGKSLLNTLMFHHHHHNYGAFTCRSHDPNLSIISPRIMTTTTDYEFSCSNSPANPFQAIKQRSKHNRYYSSNKSKPPSCQYDDVSTLSAVQKVLEMLNNNNNECTSKVFEAPSPLVTLPGFGKSPIGGRQLRVTDSPFPLKDDDDGDTQVDVAAEEFIKRFYKDLNLQKRSMAALDSPYHNSWDRSVHIIKK